MVYVVVEFRDVGIVVLGVFVSREAANMLAQADNRRRVLEAPMLG